jgi:2',3'-cyclic-nucleotide 2'-phosphodiesterase (5'-nucleotidase family)
MIDKRQSKIKICFYLLKTLRFPYPGCTLTLLQQINTYHRIFFIVSLIVVQSCTTVRPIPAEVQYKTYVVSGEKQDTTFLKMLSPYRDSIVKTMNNVIGFATETLTKSNGNPGLGNLFTDAMKEMAEKHFARKVDAAIMNSGGIRSYIPKGEITIGKVYELMPFDNLLVLQEMKGSLLKQFLDHAASKGGWPLSGITMTVKNRKAENILVAGKPLDENATYVIAQPDYVANGGDNSEMIKNVPQVNIGYVLRDALIEYIRQFTASGKPVTASPEKRVTHADQP